MTVVPSVIVDQRGAIGHSRNLVTVIPPRHDPGLLVCVLSQPVVGLAEVVQDVSRSEKATGTSRMINRYQLSIEMVEAVRVCVYVDVTL